MERLDRNQNPSVETARFLVEFLEVAITSIVFHKGIYHPGAFERKRYLNLVVHRVRHPQLKHYIHSTVQGLLPYIQKGLVEKVAVILLNSDDNPFERFVFKFALSESSNCKATESESELSIKSFLTKLPVSELLKNPLPKDYRWEITGFFNSLPEANTSEEILWIPSNGKKWQHLPLITPIKTVNNDASSVQLYCEHSSTSEAKP